MADGKIEIETAIDTDGINKGVKDVNQSLGKLKSAVKGIGISAVIGAEVKALKALGKGIQDTANAYNTQLKAETLLSASAKNNPLLNGESVEELKSFASELQSVTTYGDEQLIPLMAQLSTSGRSQTEIMDIMKTATDLASSGLVSLDQAVLGLNQSLSGNIGQLGRYVPQLKNLSKEELESGKAIEIVKNQFKGMAEATTEATGSFQQMKNAQGDFKEALGTITKPTADLWNNFWKGWYERGIENINKLNRALDVAISGKKLAGLAGRIDENGNSILKEYNQEQLELALEYIEKKKNKTSEDKNNLIYLKEEIALRKRLNQWEAKEAEALEKKNKAQKEIADKEKEIQDYKDSNSADLERQLQKIEEEYKLKEKLGESIDKEAYHQERLNAMMSAYISLITESNGEVTENTELSKERVKQMEEEAKALSKSEEGVSKLKEIGQGLKENFEDITSAVEQLTEALTDLNENNYMASQADALDELNDKYRKGELSYEEYIKAQEKLDKEYAEKKYQLELAEWSIKLATATANIATAITKDLAEGGGTLGAIKAITTGALGAGQIATIIASKPTRGYASGGIVGATAGGDNTYGIVGLRNGEMILNAQQQRELWSVANGARAGGAVAVNMPINIENNARADVSTQFDGKQLRVIINDIVNAGFRDGSYDSSISVQQANYNGRTIL